MDPILPATRIDITVLIDNLTDTLSTTPAFVTREIANLRRHGMPRWNGAGMCCAVHGYSLVITAQTPDGPHTVLFDAGPWSFALDHNAARLGVPLSEIAAVVLSHGHTDHAGGLTKAIELIHAANGRRPVPCYLHPGMFAERGLSQPDGGVFPMDFVPSPEQLTTAGAQPVVTTDPQSFGSGAFWLSDEIPRTTAYERGLINQVTRTTPDAPWTPDPLVTDERFLAARVQNKGLVIFSACSHAGIINVLRHARETFPNEPLYAVMGGFHLSAENEAIIPETVRDIGGFGLSLIVPAHCSGWRALNALERAYGERVVLPSAVGKTFSL